MEKLGNQVAWGEDNIKNVLEYVVWGFVLELCGVGWSCVKAWKYEWGVKVYWRSERVTKD
jgi:hypothetical protein